MPEIELTGAVDLHLHTAPDVFDRSVDDHQAVAEAASAGMRALLLKSHHTLTADRATLTRPEGGIEVFGGLALNHPVGGLNLTAVETALAFGARQIWMPTLHAANSLKRARIPAFQVEACKGLEGLTVLDADGRLKPVVYPLLEMVRDAGAILGTGHLAPDESLVLLAEARKMGMTRLLVTHPLMHFIGFDRDRLRRAVEHGALLEFDYLSCLPGWHEAIPVGETAAAIREVGPEHCVLATDGGQKSNPHPAAMLGQFAQGLAGEGFTPEEIRLMMCENPARLLGLGV